MVEGSRQCLMPRSLPGNQGEAASLPMAFCTFIFNVTHGTHARAALLLKSCPGQPLPPTCMILHPQFNTTLSALFDHCTPSQTYTHILSLCCLLSEMEIMEPALGLEGVV